MLKPILIYDGNCEFCQYCVDYLALVTKKNVQFCAYQQNTHGLDLAQCKKSIQLIETDQRVYQGAAAGFKVLSYGSTNRGWWLYKNLPGWAWVTEKIHSWVTRHRDFCCRLAKVVCGNPWQPGRLTLLSLGMLGVLISFILILKIQT